MVVFRVLGGVLMCLIAGRDSWLTASLAVVAGPCRPLPPLCRADGPAVAPAPAVWLGYEGVLTWRSPAPGRKSKALLRLVFASAALLLVVFYFIGYQKPSYHPASAGVWPSLLASLEFVSSGVGTVPAETFWPYLGLALLGLTVISLVVLVRICCRSPQERIRAAGLLMFLGAVGALTLAIGWGRSGFGSGAGIASRYTTLAAPALRARYFAWVMRSKRVGQFVQMVLFLLMATSLWTNNSLALASSPELRERTRPFERDLDAGAPPSLLAERYSTLYIAGPEGPLAVEDWLHDLHRAGIAPFRSMKEDPA